MAGEQLFHYTSTLHLPMIMESKCLTLTESNLVYEKPMYKPCVWLTTSEDPKNNGLDGSIVDKTEIKITVKWQKYLKFWVAWSKSNKIDKSWAKELTKGENPSSWWISEQVIPFSDLAKIENRYTGEVYFKNEN